MKKWIRHNQGMAGAIILAIGVLFWTYGCESQVKSILNPSAKVTRAELDIEVSTEMGRLENELATLVKIAEARNQQLDKQDEFKKKLVEFGLAVAEGGSLNPVGVGASIITLLGIGSVVDNRIKDKVIKNRPIKT